MILHSRRILGAGPVDVVEGWVHLEGDRIASVESTPPAGAAPVTEIEGWLAPGFVDLHAHGGGGATFQTGLLGDAATAVDFHRRHGTTTMLASLVSGPLDDLAAATRTLRQAVEAGLVAGVHLEGPFLAQARRGAHAAALLRAPDPAALARLLDAGPVAVVTLAPELPGALEAIATIVRHGAIAAIGHTDATYEQTRAAIDAGARLGTHLFNGMRPVHHREPGPVPALLADHRIVVELIADGVHLHPGLVADLLGRHAPRIALVTDAIAATGLSDGDYVLGDQPITVRNGVARLVEGDSLAGSTLTMARAVRTAIGAGAAPATAVEAATLVPSRLLGLDAEIGRIAPGLRADLVALDEAFVPQRVWLRGRELR